MLLDGVNLKDLSLRWLRQQVGLVSQVGDVTEVLFPFVLVSMQAMTDLYRHLNDVVPAGPNAINISDAFD